MQEEPAVFENLKAASVAGAWYVRGEQGQVKIAEAGGARMRPLF